MARFTRAFSGGIAGCCIVTAWLATGCAEGTLDTEVATAGRTWVIESLPPESVSTYDLAPPPPPPPRRPRVIRISLAGLQLESDTPEGRMRTRMQLDRAQDALFYREDATFYRDLARSDPRARGYP